MNRTIAKLDGIYTCIACGKAVTNQFRPHLGECGCQESDTAIAKAPTDKPGLGDMVAAGLATVGITKERVSKVLGRDCGCAKRQAALNEFGKRLGIGNADAGPSLPPQR